MGRATDTATTTEDRAALMGRLALAIEGLREEVGVSIPDLADRIEMDRDHLWRVLNGEAPLTGRTAWRTVRELSYVMEYEAMHRG